MPRSAQACARCRRLKMKCNGLANPPCQRCRVGGHECNASDTAGSEARRRMWSTHPPVPGKPASINGRLEILEERTDSLVQDAETMGVAMRGLEAPPNARSEGVMFCYYQPQGLASTEQLPPNPISSQQATPLTPLSSTSKGSYSKDRSPHELQSGSDTVWGTPFDPYRTVQDLEAEDSAPAEPLPMTCLVNPCDYSVLDEVDISFPDAEQMFSLFGQCLAPFIPPLHDTDFSTLPPQPLFILSTLYAVARYLPGTADLRLRLYRALRERLNHTLFQSQLSNWEDNMWTMKGLIVLYAYSEALNTRGGAPDDCGKFDCWAVRAIAEGWAVKMKLGTCSGTGPTDVSSITCWLWLYTMGHHMSVVQGCGKAMWAGASIRRTSSILAKCATSSRIKKMLGEVDLCILCETMENYQGQDILELANAELAAWQAKWGGLLQTHEGKSLNFHLNFTTFYLHTYLLQHKSTGKRPSQTAIAAAHAFLEYNTRLSPIDKSRLRYMSDFGFVMITFVCIFALRTLHDSRLETRSSYFGEVLMEDVGAAASLMGSFGPCTARPGIYGTKIAACLKDLRKKHAEKDCLAGVQPEYPELWCQRPDATDASSNSLLGGKNVNSATQGTGDVDLLGDVDWDWSIPNFEGLHGIRAALEDWLVRPV